MNIQHTRRSVLGLAVAAMLSAPAFAQTDWPTQTIAIVVPAAPGGVTDIVSRLMAPELQATLGRPVIVENRPGAGGQVGAEYVARARPDGYTLLMTTAGTQAIAPALFKDLPYNPVTDHAPVSFIARVPHVVAVPAKLEVRTVPELVALLKREPGKHNMASGGVGTPQQLAGELFRLQTGADFVQVAYPGSGPSLTDLVAGRATFTIDALSPAMGFIGSGALRPIAVGTRTRAPKLPDVPAMAEQGLPDFESYTWVGLYAPAKTPKAVIDKLVAAVKRAAALPAISSRMAELAYEVVASDPAGLADVQARDAAKWGDVVRRANIVAPPR